MLAFALAVSTSLGTFGAGTVPVVSGAVFQAEESQDDATNAEADPAPTAKAAPDATDPEATEAKGLDKQIDEQFGKATGWFVAGIFAAIPISEEVEVPWVLFPLVIGAIFFTLYFGFPNLRYLGTSINIIRGKYDDLEEGGSTRVSEASVSSVDSDNPDTIRIEGHGTGRNFLDDRLRLAGNVIQVCRMYAGCCLSRNQFQRDRLRWSDVLPPQRPAGKRFGSTWKNPRDHICDDVYWWFLWRWKHVPVQPSVPVVRNTNRNRRRVRLVVRLGSRGARRDRHHRWDQEYRQCY